jgi:hypothetical protein
MTIGRKSKKGGKWQWEKGGKKMSIAKEQRNRRKEVIDREITRTVFPETPDLCISHETNR